MNDILIFIRSTTKSYKNLSNTLKLYSSLIGLNINKNKSYVFFPKYYPSDIY